MPPLPSSSRISSWGNRPASSSGVGGTNPPLKAGDDCVAATPESGADWLSNPAFSKHLGHNPAGESEGISAPHSGQNWASAMARFLGKRGFYPSLKRTKELVTRI